GWCALNNIRAEDVLCIADGRDDALDALALNRSYERWSSYPVVILCRFLDVVSELFRAVHACVVENARTFFCVGVNIYYANFLTSPSALSAFMDLGDDADFAGREDSDVPSLGRSYRPIALRALFADAAGEAVDNVSNFVRARNTK